MKLFLHLLAYNLRSNKGCLIYTFATILITSLLNMQILSQLEEVASPRKESISMYSFGFGIGIGGSSKSMQAVKKDELLFSKACSYTGIITVTSAAIIISAQFLAYLKRRKQIQLLRQLGIYRHQLLLFLLVEALLLAISGSICGILLEWCLFFYRNGVPYFPGMSAICTLISACAATVAGSALPATLAICSFARDSSRYSSCRITLKQTIFAGIAGSLLLLAVHKIATLPAAEHPYKLQIFLYAGVPMMFIGFGMIMPALIHIAEWLAYRPVARLLLLHLLFIKRCLTRGIWRSLAITLTLSIGLSLFVALHAWSASMLTLFTIPQTIPDSLLRVHPCLANAEIAEEIKASPSIVPGQLAEIAVAQPQLAPDLIERLHASGTMGDNAITIGMCCSDFKKLLHFPLHPPDAASVCLTSGQRFCLIPETLAMHGKLHIGSIIKLRKADGDFANYKVIGTFDFPWLWFTKCTGLRLSSARTAALIFVPHQWCLHDFQAQEHEFYWFNKKADISAEVFEKEMIKTAKTMAIIYDNGSQAYSGGTRWDSGINENFCQYSSIESLNASLESRTHSVISKMERMPITALIMAGLAIICSMQISISSRKREISIQYALGASNSMLMRGLISETSLICLCACAVSSFVGIYYAKIANSMLDCAPVFGVLSPRLNIPWREICTGYAITCLVTIAAAAISLCALLHKGSLMKYAKQNCFTLMELLSVISIIALLSAMLLPALLHAREEARSTACTSLLKQYAYATSMYADEYDDIFPDIRTYLKQDFFTYMGAPSAEEALTRCPDDATTAQLNRLGEFSHNGKIIRISIGGTVNLSDSQSATSKGASLFISSRNNAYLNKEPSLRCQWTDYQNQGSSRLISGAAMSIGKGFGSSRSSLEEYVFRHLNASSNAAFCDGHVSQIRLIPSAQPINAGHDLLQSWIFPGNCTWPYGPRQGPPSFPDTIRQTSVVF